MENDAVIFDFPNRRALFEIAILSGIEDDSITRFERWDLLGRRSVEADPTVLCFDDGAEKRSAFFPNLPWVR